MNARHNLNRIFVYFIFLSHSPPPLSIYRIWRHTFMPVNIVIHRFNFPYFTTLSRTANGVLVPLVAETMLGRRETNITLYSLYGK